MKKIAFISILCLCFILLVSCNSEDEPIDIFTDESRDPDETVKCEHVFGEWETVGADNCVTEGVDIRTCRKCAYEETRAVMGTEHAFVGESCELCGAPAPTKELEYTTSGGEYIAIINDAITAEILVIPEEHKGKPVTQVMRRTFCTSVREVYIPASIVKIESGAFSNMSNLETVHIPQDSNITTIGNGAFRTCTSLREISFENCKKLTSIGDEAFYGCTELETVILPDSVDTLYSGAFSGCTKLKNFEYTGAFKQVAHEAFANCTSLENINFMNKSSVIASSMFFGCTGLKNIRIPDSVTKIEQHAFANSGLENIALPQSIETVERGIFMNCEQLKTVELNNVITTLSKGMFQNCSSLVEVSGGAVISRIEKEAFSGCTALSVLGFETSDDLVVETDAFVGCDSLENIPS